MKNEKQYLSKLEDLINSSDLNLEDEYCYNLRFVDTRKIDKVIKCAEKTLKAYRTHANNNFKKIEKVLDLSNNF